MAKILLDDSYLEGLDSLEGEADSASEKDRDLLARQIESMVSRPARPVPTPPTSGRKDHTLPYVVLAAAVVSIVAAALIGAGVFRRRVDRMGLDPYGFASGEGRVLAQYRKESEERIRQKDAEILAILR